MCVNQCIHGLSGPITVVMITPAMQINRMTALPISWPYFHTVSPFLMSTSATLWPIGIAIFDLSRSEELLAVITADIGAQTTAEILERIRQQVERRLVGDVAELKGLIREYLLEILQAAERPIPKRVV